MSHPRARLEVDELGDRILPSVTVLTPPVTSGKVIVGPRVTLTTLSGSGRGTLIAAPTRFGAGAAYYVRATGNITGMGSVRVSGLLNAPALTATGPVTGLLTLINANGSITVSLTTSAQTGRSPLPTSYQYQVVGSSGEFFGSSAQGTMHLNFTQGRTNVLTFSF